MIGWMQFIAIYIGMLFLYRFFQSDLAQGLQKRGESVKTFISERNLTFSVK